jgi:hypothetical protein
MLASCNKSAHAGLYEPFGAKSVSAFVVTKKLCGGVAEMSRVIQIFCLLPMAFAGVGLAGCTSDPYAPINQTTPVKQLDNLFDPSGSRYYERGAPAPYAPQGYAPSPYSRY